MKLKGMRMNDINVAILKFKRNNGTVKKAVESVDAFEHLPGNAKVVIKPNIVVWLDSPNPKWGVITTSVIMEETVILLKEKMSQCKPGNGFRLHDFTASKPAAAFGHNNRRYLYP